MENGPAGNLRKTPGRIASHCERKTQSVVPETPLKQLDYTPTNTPKNKRRKKSSEKKKRLRNRSKGGKSKPNPPEWQSTVADFIATTGKSAAKSLLQTFNDTELNQGIKVSERIKRFEEGYATDPEIELRKLNLQANKAKLQTYSKTFKTVYPDYQSSLARITTGSQSDSNINEHSQEFTGLNTLCDEIETIVNNTCNKQWSDRKVNKQLNNEDNCVNSVNNANVQLTEENNSERIAKLKQPLIGDYCEQLIRNSNTHASLNVWTSNRDEHETISDTVCLADDCNYSVGEVVNTGSANHNQRDMSCVITTTAHINATTSSTYSSVLLGTSMSTSMLTAGMATSTVPFNRDMAYHVNNAPLPAYTTGYGYGLVESGPGQMVRNPATRLLGLQQPQTSSLYIPKQTVSAAHGNVSSCVPPLTPNNLTGILPEVEVPPNLDMATMFKMLCHISAQVDSGNQNAIATKQEMVKYNQQMSEITQDVEDQRQILHNTVDSLNKYVDKVDILSNIATKNNDDIQYIKRRFELMDIASHKNKLIISGMVEKAEENLIHEILTFFKVKLLIDDTITVLNARRVGQGKVRPVEVTLENINDKGMIYKHTKNLKDTVNENGYKYQIRDVLPERVQEEDNRRRQLLRENKSRAKSNTAHKINMSVKRKQLYMNNQLYKKRAPMPTDKDMLIMSEEERERVQMARLAAVPIYKERDNRFISYVLEAEDMQEIRATSRHLRLKHPDATSITLAYNLISENPETTDYDDNGEYRAGSRILKAITDRQTSGVAVYLVRYHSGQKLGARRFEIFREMADKALDLLVDRDNFFASRIPANSSKVKMTKTNKHRTKGRVTGARGAAHSNRGRGGYFSPTTH